MFMQTEQFTLDRPTTSNQLILFQFFPSQTRIAGPVVILQGRTVLISYKLLLPDADIVIAAPCRRLWQGGSEQAFDIPQGITWKIAAIQRKSGLVTL